MLRFDRSFVSSLLAISMASPLLVATPAHAEAPQALKDEVVAEVAKEKKQIQVMVDEIFSFAEPGFQEKRSSAYLADILEKHGFTITRGVAGIPTAFTATWGEGGPKIALGADMDDVLGVSQMPGVPYMKPIVPGAPGHGEGHNAGLPLVVASAIATKNVMERHHLKGRLMVWASVAEELLATKAYLVRDGVFDGVDASLFAHVGNEFRVTYGPPRTSGMVSVEYTFHGKTAHSAAMPWEGRSALDAAEIMDVAWNFRREHLPITQRSHMIISNGGGQPNVVPDKASIWYYFRDTTFDGVRKLYETGNEIAKGAAIATGTSVTQRTLGYAAPIFGNKPLAEATHANMEIVGMPKWSAEDQAFAKVVQTNNDRKLEPLRSEVTPLKDPKDYPPAMGGGSDDYGDVSWTVPSIMLIYPANIPNMIGHHATSAIAMATPIAHKGTEAGAKVMAMTTLDLLTTPSILADAQDYYRNVTLKYDTYAPLITAEDKPAIDRNETTMQIFRPLMEKYYYDPKKYDSYLDQLGVKYPDLSTPAK